MNDINELFYFSIPMLLVNTFVGIINSWLAREFMKLDYNLLRGFNKIFRFIWKLMAEFYLSTFSYEIANIFQLLFSQLEVINKYNLTKVLNPLRTGIIVLSSLI